MPGESGAPTTRLRRCALNDCARSVGPGQKANFSRLFAAQHLEALGVAREGQSARGQRLEVELARGDQLQGALACAEVVVFVADQRQAAAPMRGIVFDGLAQHAENSHCRARAIH